ncbi:hypothetical protein Vadar_019880 [Vaccinium darrowii]|uniref:Uncharacterized protein n=1 Tax=Vaccinium darrowii TaxID=229202 RepID=A0ACB7XB85_9ERIC|nr:hypothetical protein Vadar_019880 [Vaccinium darrowii]
MVDIANRASIDHSGKKFATREANISSLQSIYGLGQCTPDLSDYNCKQCLLNAITKLPEARLGGRNLFRSCFVWFEMYPFYNASFGAAPPPPLPVVSPPPGKGGISSQVIIAVVVPIGIAIMLFIAGFCFITRRAKKKYNTLREDNVGDDISTIQSLQYDLGTIQTATNNFSDNNKIGEGGFGPVYKGVLLDGQEVAVKRLSRTSGQDFGMARIFGVDQTQGNTSRVVGTFGYMSPEYAMHGQFSVKLQRISLPLLMLVNYIELLLALPFAGWKVGIEVPLHRFPSGYPDEDDFVLLRLLGTFFG